MGASYNNIIERIDEHLKNSGRRYYSDFYIGITNDPERRLFDEHNVKKDYMWWIYSKADNIEIARKVEKHYLDKGMRGGDGGGDDTSVYVYCYTVSPTTIEY